MVWARGGAPGDRALGDGAPGDRAPWGGAPDDGVPGGGAPDDGVPDGGVGFAEGMVTWILEDSPSVKLEVEEAKVTAPAVTLIPISTGTVTWLICSNPPIETLISRPRGNWTLVSGMWLMIGLWDRRVL